jgi:hypothetical protein
LVRDDRDRHRQIKIREGLRVTVQLEGFAAEAIDEEASRLGVPVDELVSFSVMYYLADVDSGRIARDAFGCPYPSRDPD